MTAISTAVVIGGGIAGMSAAIALSRVGVRCEVVELAESALGASLGISGRAADALKELGVYDACFAAGKVFEKGSGAAAMMDSAGNQLSAGPKRPEWPGASPTIGIYRPVLARILTDAAEALGVIVTKGLSADDVAETDNGAVVTLNDGSRRQCDMVVAADGIWSKTRGRLFPDVSKPHYAGQFSIRWMAPGPPIAAEHWYMSPVGRLGGYALPHGDVYVPSVINRPTGDWIDDGEAHRIFTELIDSFTAPRIVELRRRLTPQSKLIARPFEWILVPDPWFRGRTILIGDAAHATTAHMGMGGGMALEDAVVLAQCIDKVTTLHEAFETFLSRRMPRVRTVVERRTVDQDICGARGALLRSSARWMLLSALRFPSPPQGRGDPRRNRFPPTIW